MRLFKVVFLSYNLYRTQVRENRLHCCSNNKARRQSFAGPQNGQSARNRSTTIRVCLFFKTVCLNYGTRFLPYKESKAIFL